MRPSSIAFAIALAVALPSGAALLPHVFAPWVYPALLGFGFGVGLAAMAALDFADFWRGRAVDLRLDVAQAEAKELANVEWRARLAGPVIVEQPDKESDYDPEREAWRVALDRFFRAGETAGGFSAGKLSGVAGSDAWPRLVHFYASEQGGNVLRDAGGNTGHTWGHGWTLDRVMLALGTNRLPRPDIPLPVIAPYVASTAQRRAPRKGATPARVVDGTARAAE